MSLKSSIKYENQISQGQLTIFDFINVSHEIISNKEHKHNMYFIKENIDNKTKSYWLKGFCKTCKFKNKRYINQLLRYHLKRLGYFTFSKHTITGINCATCNKIVADYSRNDMHKCVKNQHNTLANKTYSSWLDLYVAYFQRYKANTKIGFWHLIHKNGWKINI